MTKKTYTVIGMSCASCQAHVYDSVKKINGVNDVNVNLVTNKMTVTFDEELVTEKMILDSVRHAGYDLSIKTGKEKRSNFTLTKLIVSLILSFILSYITMGKMLFDAPTLKIFDNNVIYIIAQMILVIPVVILNFRFFTSGFKKLIVLKPNMDSLVALSATTSLVYSLVLSIITFVTGNMTMLYFESASMILSLVSLGKWVENISKDKTLNKINDLMKLSPTTANIKEKGKTNISDVKIGDIVIVKAGDTIPVDGIITSGSGSISEANITGESVPVFKEKENYVYASTTLLNGYIEVRVEKEGKNRVIDEIINMVSEASNSKAPISRLADKVSLYFVPAVILISIISFVVNLIISKDLSLSINFALSVLVIACPCSLGLSTPIAILVGVTKGASLKILYKNAIVLENSSRVEIIIFDKTGTITEGIPSVIKCDLKDEYKDIVYSLEYESNHPLSLAITSYLNNSKKLDVKDFSQIAGDGITGIIDSKRYYLGNFAFLSKKGIKTNENSNNSIIYLFTDNELLGSIEIFDNIKTSSYLLINKLKKMGIKTILLTGDKKEVADRIGSSLGFDATISEVLPAVKGYYVKKFVEDGHNVMMVGDGVNDSLALEYATVGVSLTGSSNIATNSSDIILPNNDMEKLATTLKLSKRVLTTIKISLFWAFFYNVIGIILSSGLFYYSLGIKLSPEISALCMGLSSIMVVLNALTINLFKEKKEENKMEELKINVDGMMCEHCKKNVYDTVMSCSGVVEANVSLEEKNVTIKGNNLNKEEIVSKINSKGYKAK